jgi:single-stranded-DNA-specific exonuclease
MKKKILRRPQQEACDFNQVDLHPLLKRIYPTRGIQSSHEIERGLEHLLPFDNLLGLPAAVECLVAAIQTRQNILIVGDFDADGATSTAVAMRALRSFGVSSVSYLVPNRFAFGYGLTPELVAVAKDMAPDLIITVDNGIANHAGVAAAKALGITVVITDHHLAAETLPIADAIVNPNQPGDEFGSKNLAGVGVIFYVMLAVRRALKNINWFAEQNIPEPNMSRLLDLVALGTVADVVSLDQNNRILVHQGLLRIRAGLAAPGITAILECSGRQPQRLQATDLGFAIAPRLNAAGRLEDMSLGIDCLLSDDMAQAREIAEILNNLNGERRTIEQDMQEQAFRILKKIQTGAESFPQGICLFDHDWHQGVIGIVAGRVKDKFNRPVIAFAKSTAFELKGSARSINGLHIRDVLADVDRLHPGLINKYGGHAMAAGLTLPLAAYADFAAAFDDVVTKKLSQLNLQNILFSDGELLPLELSIATARILREGGPWGQSFPEPIFDGMFRILQQRLVGQKHLKLTLQVADQTIDAIAFNIDIKEWPNYRCEEINIAYRLDINEYRGKETLQLIIEQIELANMPVVA